MPVRSVREARPLCLLASPYGEAGGGMGRIADTLADEAQHRALPVRFERLETRGRSRAGSLLVLLRAAGRVIVASLVERELLLHVNVAERGSVLRKGVLILLARLLGRPVLLHVHAAQLVGFAAGLPAPLRRLLGWTFRRATLCVVLSQAMRGWMTGCLGVPAARVVVLRNGVPMRLASPAARGERFRLLFLGNLSERKGVPELLAALAHPALAGWHGELVLAGGGDVGRFEAQAAALGLSAKLRLTGWLDEAAAAAELAAADALVLPSHDEGLPLVILEALAQRVPVITTPVGAIPEVLRHEATALLVPPGDPAGLAEAVARLAGDRRLREALADAGRALYEQEFTASVFVDRLTALYQQYCGFSAPSGAFQLAPHAPLSAP